jgi:hypothetical protein
MCEDFTDDRATQESLIKRPARAEPETRLDRGSSDAFADDRREAEREPEAGEQSGLTFEPAGDGDQMDLSGDRAGETPEWRED